MPLPAAPKSGCKALCAAITPATPTAWRSCVYVYVYTPRPPFVPRLFFFSSFPSPHPHHHQGPQSHLGNIPSRSLSQSTPLEIFLTGPSLSFSLSLPPPALSHALLVRQSRPLLLSLSPTTTLPYRSFRRSLTIFRREEIFWDRGIRHTPGDIKRGQGEFNL